MTALNAILARQGQINPQSGVVGGQQGLPMSGGVMQSKPLGMQGTIPQGGNVVQGQRLQAPVGYNRDPRQNAQFNALSPQDQERYYQGGMNRASGQNPMLNNKANAINMPIQDQYSGTGMMQSKPPGMKGTMPQGEDVVGDNGQTRTNMGELSNDEWLKRMNIAQPSSDQTSLRTDIESAAPVDGDPVESRIQTLMQRRGMTREEATANQESAVSQGGDFNNDGAVSNEEWSQFKNGGEQPPMEQPPVEQAPMEQASQNNFGSGFQDFINQPQVQEFIDQASSKKSSSPPQYGGGMMGGRQGGMMGGMRGNYGGGEMGGGIMRQQSPSSYGSYGGGYRPDRPQYRGQQYGGGGGYSTGNYGAPRQYTPQERQSLPGNMAPEDRYPDPAMDNSGYNGYGQQYRYDPRFNAPSF